MHPGMRGTRLLVGVELALATMLCVGAGLVAKSTGELLSTDVGIEPDGLVYMVMDLLKGLHNEGATICMVTHDPRFACSADRTVHLFDGKVVSAHEAQRRASIEDDG